MSDEVAYTRLTLSVEEIVNLVVSLPASQRPIVLDSCQHRDFGLFKSRYLIAAFNPSIHFQYFDQAARQDNSSRVEELDRVIASEKLFSDKNREIPRELWAFASGLLIGFLSYDLGREFEKLPSTARRVFSPPDIYFAFYKKLIVYDYYQKEALLFVRDGDADVVLKEFKAEVELYRSGALIKADVAKVNSRVDFTSNFNHSSYVSAVEKIKDYIRVGDIYQANLTQQLQIDLSSRSPEKIFLAIRTLFPVPFAAFIKTPDWSVVSASPEMFLSKKGLRVATCPIKGTRRRGKDSDEDALLAKELLQSEKDLAENIMIVDLMRNDLGRVAQVGSVDASQILKLQSLPTLHHLVSKVECRLRQDVSLNQLLSATFPCGSITGAPKIRSMEIIEEVEGVRRGLSMGAIGWLGCNGDLEMSVAIRTVFIEKGIGYFNVGGAVVADSNPAQEYEESMLKAEAVLRAIENSY
ncbi:MAG: aminodeoxychorismate synthase component I [Blastocatellia bacterium]|nr:aminodeoxychorismate synthase component I [Blastocatellia bacterium]